MTLQEKFDLIRRESLQQGLCALVEVLSGILKTPEEIAAEIRKHAGYEHVTAEDVKKHL